MQEINREQNTEETRDSKDSKEELREETVFEKRSAGSWLMIAVSVAILVALDQFTKYLAVTKLSGEDSLVLIDGVLDFVYLENHGAAFSMLQNQQWFFYILTTVFFILAVVVLHRLPQNAKYRPMTISVVVLLSGAAGNFIDRVVNRYVIDFIYVELINFPVFNVADIYVTVGVTILIVLMIFKYKDEDLKVLFRSRKSG
jgi:signal peptidase II